MNPCGKHMAFNISYHVASMKRWCVRRGGMMRYNITTHSTGARVSSPLIVNLSVSVLCARPVNSGVRFLLNA
jgi:hypothetical protein